VSKPCPVCYGKKLVTVILGNDDRIFLPCEYCARGYEAPSGLTQEYEYVVEPELVVITSVTLKITDGGVEAKYYSSVCSYDEEALFVTKEEAAVVSQGKKEALEREQDTKVENLKKNVHKSFSWNAGYHLREAKRSRKQAEYHDKKAVLCKARSKEKLDEDA
jgi:hypothetical protein